MTIYQFNKRMKGLVPWLANTITVGLRDLGEDMVDMNVEQMEVDGEDSRGQRLKNPKTGDTAYADPDYAAEKASMGKESEYINLNMTGDFHGSMDFKISTNGRKSGVDIFAKDPKTDKLIGTYGVDIFGLTEDNFNEIVDELTAYLAQELAIYFA